MVKALAQRFIGWLDRVVDADDRVICAVCDQRFMGFEDGTVHVRMTHPQFVYGYQPTVPVSHSPSVALGGFQFTQLAYAYPTN